MEKITKQELTQQLLKEYLSYNTQTGHLTWIKRPSKRIHKNKRAGFDTKSGYRAITFMGTQYPEHHLIWFYMYGKWPEEIDHINHIKSDNGIANLREITHTENSRNMKQLDNTITGVQGIYHDRKKDRYTATIRMNNKVVFSKSCGSDEQELNNLIKEREAKLLELGFHPNHGK